ncbi:PIR protein [Plasmodium yoelii]|uniref:PIR protein n=2 Tax=Plasmodium yoelii TaxID=5861 RepID=A0AAE9WQA2_PLAYO|nr:PIR protein [Plasmodium yoelii]WBY54668.1 PIR protein [Plasmodium yoelii yoelii]CDU16036.1 YIR protein [Plasmodium yoelii]VTZ71660.1 PIR protein [Plasmodium yoelii]|eukprot:XP_022811327.1 PIR protein [Plasmodium yoelii]
MDDDLCGHFVILRNYFPDELGKTPGHEFHQNKNINKYCPIGVSGNNECNTDLDKIKAVLLWLFERNCSKFKKAYSDENQINPIFLYIVLWLSYKLNQNSDHYFTKINDFYIEYVNGDQQYNSLINDANKCTNLKEIIDKTNYLLNINIEDMSNFYDAFKLLCNVHDKVSTNAYDNTLLNNAIHFFNKYAEINDYYNIENTPYSKILSTLSTDYNKLKNKCASIDNNPIQFPSLPTGRATKSFLRNSSIKISLIPMTFIFFALIIYLGILYKRSSFDFRKRLQKINLRIKKIKRKINH